METPAQGAGAPDPAPERRRNALVTGLGLATVVTFAFVRALEDQLGRLQRPLADSFGYDALHGDDVAVAWNGWLDGARTLTRFGTIDPVSIVTVHVGFDILFAALLATVLALLVRRLGLPDPLLVLIGIGFLADLAENILELALVREWQPIDGRYATAFRWLGLFKLLPLLVAAIVVAVIVHRGGVGRAWRYYRNCSATSRLILAAAIGFAFLLQFGDIGAQAEDLLRRELTAFGLARAAFFLAVYLAVIAIVRRIGIGGGVEPKAREIILGGLGLVAIGLVPLVVSGRTSALVVLGAMVFAIGVASWVVGSEDGGAESDQPGAILYVFAGILPPAGLALLAARLLAGEVATDRDWELLVLVPVVLLAVAVAVGWLFARPVEMRDRPDRSTLLRRVDGFSRPLTAALVLIVIAVAALAVVQAFSPESSDSVGDVLGPFGVLLLAMGAFAAAAGLVRLVARDLGRPAIFAWFKMPRTPVVTLLVVWFFAVNVYAIRLEDSESSPHLVRRLDRAEQPADATCAEDLSLEGTEVAVALCHWLVENAKTPDGVTPRPGPVPLVLASASGGGVRAAAWTARVLDCLLLGPPKVGDDPCGAGRVATRDSDNWSRLFAAGGASGGSVGIVSTLAHRITKSTTRKDWIHALAGDDHVSRVTARLALSELPLVPLGIATDHDRAEVLIDSWTSQLEPVSGQQCPTFGDMPISDVGFLALRDQCRDRVPLLMLNGTVVKTGKRFDISPLDLAGEQPGLVDVLCATEDVPLLDAAFLSARFPFVTPSGHFTEANDEDDECSRDTRSAVEVVDGGYAENSGAAQIGALWSRLDPLIDKYNEQRPAGFREVRAVFVQIDNGERRRQPIGIVELDGTFGATVGEPLKPLSALFAARFGGTEAAAMENLRAQLKRDDVPVVEAALYPHPGRRLPLGWALTKAILDDVDHVFRLRPNVCAAKVFRAYLHGKSPATDETCPRSR